MELVLYTLLALVGLIALGGLFCKYVFDWTWKKYFSVITDWF